MALIPADEPQRKAILQEIGATEQEIESSKNVLKEWLKQNPHLPQNMSDILLASFVVQSKNSLERAKEWMELYYTRQTSNLRDSFIGIDPNSMEMQRSFNVVQHGMCRRMTPEGFRVQVFRIIDPDPNKYEPIYVIKRIFMLASLRLSEEYLEGGECIVFDCVNFSMAHMTRLTPMLAKQLILSAKLVPCRLKKIICINAPSILDTFVGIVKTFLDEKLRNRLHVYSGDHTTLYQHIPREVLPKEYGGDDLSYEELNEYWHNRCLKARDWLLDKSIQQTDESKRVGPFKFKSDQMFGTEGSFKTLAID